MNKIFTKNKDIDVRRLRCTLGWLAIALPWIVAILIHEIPASISATYYTYEAGPVFMIILGACSILLIAYKGYDKIDDWLNTAAGFFGLIICMFPCLNNDMEYVGTFSIPMNVSATIHNLSAVVFFAILAYNSAFRFTKGNKIKTKKKKCRDTIYIICAVGMILSFTLFLLPDFHIKTWLIETIALFFFGISFLTKSNCYKFLFAEDNEDYFVTCIRNYIAQDDEEIRIIARRMIEERFNNLKKQMNALAGKSKELNATIQKFNKTTGEKKDE